MKKHLFFTCFKLSFFFLLPSTDLADSLYPVAAKHSMVVSEQRLASQIGSDILRAGGNAVDAAVAVGYALAVVDPCCGNIGGGGFMTLHLANGKNIFLNFREKAPLKANKNMFVGTTEKSTKGYLAVAVPGTVLGLDYALQKYGTLSRQQVMAPAIYLAQRGFIITSFLSNQFRLFTDTFRKQPNIAAIFLKSGQALQPGDRLIQTDLANTLKQIATKGPEVFYKGAIAQTIVAESQKNDGILSLQDFADYTVEELNPITCSYRGYTLISAPPPSSGGVTLCEMLNILENFPLTDFGYQSTQSVRTIVEAMRYGFSDRNAKLGDPDFIHNPVEQLISKDYAAEISQKIKNSHLAMPFKTPTPSPEHVHTTHYSIVDDRGNAVALTYTLNGYFGAQVIADHTGFFLNDQMDDFETNPGKGNQFGLVQGDSNAIQPGKRPLSSMTPTIILKNGRLVMVLGSPGGPRIITSVMLTILNFFDYGMNIQQAVDAPRFHYQDLPDVIDTEPFAFSFAMRKKLEYLGYHIASQKPWGVVEAIYIDSANHTLYGANDRRRPDGQAIGH